MNKKYSKNYLLSGNDVLTIAGKDAIVLDYPQLYNYPSIESLFTNGINKILLLYLTSQNDNEYMGHWVALVKRGNHVVHFDSYGLMPDSEIKFNDMKKRQELNQNINYLTRLLYDYCLKGGIVEYNQYHFQKHGTRINTCGRWASLYAHFYEIPLPTFQQMLLDMRKAGWNLDNLVTELTNEFLK